MNIDMIFLKLDERNASEVQREGIEYAKEVKSLSVFFQPTEGKALWHNCAVVIAERGDEELEPYLSLYFFGAQGADKNFFQFAFIFYYFLLSFCKRLCYNYHKFFLKF